MDYRDEKFVSATAITMEINHPVLGWIPFTAAQDDVEVHGRDLFAAASATATPYVAPEPDPPTAEQVNAERDRRIYAGTAIDVAGYGIIPLTGRERDQINLMTLASRAQAMKAAGVTTASMTIRDRDNINHLLTPDHMIQLVASGVAWIEATMKVSWDMKDRAGEFPNGIPADYTDDSYWP